MPDLWPYIPLPDIEEELAWATDLGRSRTDEMRFTLRDGRQTLSYKYRLTDGYQEAAAKLRSAPYGTWYVPLWEQSSTSGPVLDTDATLTVDLNAEYTDLAVVYGACDDYTIVEIDSITSTLNLTSVVGASYTNPTVAPVRECQLLRGAQITRGTKRHTSYDLDFLATEFLASSGSSFTLLDGLPYLSCSIAAVTPLAGAIRQDVGVVDDGVSFPTLVDVQSIIDHVYSVTLVHTSWAEHINFRAFLGDIKGRAGAFWISDWEGNLGVTALSGATSVDFSTTVSDPTIHVGRYLNFGTEVRPVLAASDLGGGVHRLVFDALTANSGTIRFLRKVRMNTDRVKINHRRGFYARTNFPVLEVTA